MYNIYMKSTELMKKSIKELLRGKQWTVASLSRELQVTRFTINSWINGEVLKIKEKDLLSIAKILGKELTKINTRQDSWALKSIDTEGIDNIDLIDETFRSVGTIPVIDNFNRYYIEGKTFDPKKMASSYIYKPSPISDLGAYGLTIFDNSMYPKFKKGDLVIASPTKYFSDECYAVVIMSGILNICNITKRKNKYILSKYNDPEFYKTRSELKMCHPIVWTKEF